MQTRVDPTRDIIYVNGNRLPKRLPPKVYFALNKPKGFVTITDHSLLLFFFFFLSMITTDARTGNCLCSSGLSAILL